MPEIQEQQAEPEISRPGVDSELKRLKADTAATAAELREFVASLKGKGPQEVLGAVAQSGLTRSIAVAFAGFIVLLVLCSVIPYGYHKIWPAKPEQKTAENLSDANSAETAAETDSDSTEAEVAAGGGDDLTNKLGIGETKVSDPKSNPLESNPNLDKLLDGVD